MEQNKKYDKAYERMRTSGNSIQVFLEDRENRGVCFD